MLNADVLALDLPSYDPGRQDHDLLVRMVEEVRAVDNRSVAVQRVEIVDRADPSRLHASADLDDISEVSIVGGAGDDRITVDTTSFGAFDAPLIRFLGGDGDDRISLAGPEASDWFIDGHGGGNISGAAQVEFSDVERLGAGTGRDTLHGSRMDTDWLIDGIGAGSVGAHRFVGFENPVGAAGNQDVFTVTASGRLVGYGDGNDGGFCEVPE